MIAQAQAQTAPTIEMTTEQEAQPDSSMTSPAAGAMSNIAFVGLIVVMFYFLLIRPQQKRFKEHASMLDQLKKGDRVVTGGGLVGKIHKIDDTGEVVIDLGDGTKVTALRSTIQSKTESAKTEKPAKTAAKTKTATKTATKK